MIVDCRLFPRGPAYVRIKTMGHALNRKIAVPALAVIFAMVEAGLVPAQSGRPQGSPLQDLRSLNELREAFNRDAGKIRLILLLSPT